MMAMDIQVRMRLSSVGTGFAAGAAAGGKALQQLGAVAERQFLEILYRLSTAAGGTLRSGYEIIKGPGGKRVIDAFVKIADKMAIVEAKYKIPSKAGSALSRLTGQMQTALSRATELGNTRVVLWSWKEPATQELQLLMTHFEKIEPGMFNQIQFVYGYRGLTHWFSLYFN